MRIVHLADVHIGHQRAGAKIDPETKLNQREVDVCTAFSGAVDAVIELKPDAMLISGDLFDSVGPSNRALNFVVSQLSRLSKEGVPVVVIGGNHDTPSMRETGSVLQPLGKLAGITPVFRGQYEVVKIGEATIHCLPHAHKEGYDAEAKRLKADPKAKYNILMTHAAVAGIKEFSMGEFKEAEIPSSAFCGWDYVALGHYHKFTRVGEGVYYPGSLERLSFAEAGQKKGLIEVDLTTKEVKFHEIPGREMVDLEISASELGVEEAQGKIESLIEKIKPEGKVVRVTVKDIDPAVYRALNLRPIKEIYASATFCELRIVKNGSEEIASAERAIKGDLIQEFKGFMASLDMSEKKKRELTQTGVEYLERAMAIDMDAAGANAK